MSLCEKVNATDLAQIFGVSRRWITKLVEQGMPRDGRQFNVASCVQWYVDQLKSKHGGPEPENVLEARRLLYIEQTEKNRLENARLRSELIDADEARAVLYAVASIVGTQLDALAPRLSGIVIGMTDAAELQITLLEELRSVRDAIAREVERLPEPSRFDHSQSADTDRRRVGGRKADSAAGDTRAGAMANG